MELKIKKIQDKIELDVEAQALATCAVDCYSWYRSCGAAFKYDGGYASGCYKLYSKLWTAYW